MTAWTGTLGTQPAGTKVSSTVLGTWHDALAGLTDPWTTFTPGLTNVTLGNGTMNASYLQANKLVLFKISLTFGSTTAFTGAPRFGLPVAAIDSIAVMPCILYDNSNPATRGPGICTLNASTLVPYGNGGDVTATVPFVWAVSDVFRVTGAYEAA